MKQVLCSMLVGQKEGIDLYYYDEQTGDMLQEVLEELISTFSYIR